MSKRYEVEATACPDCGAERTVAKVQGVGLINKWKNILLLGAKDMSGVEAIVCTQCGYTRLYALDPLNLIHKRPDKPAKK